MNKILLAIITACLILSTPTICLAAAELLEIIVSDFQMHDNGEHVIIFKAIDDRVDGKAVDKRERNYIVHILYNPKSLAFPVSIDEHTKALVYLKDVLNKEKSITIWRLSGDGYRPIKGKAGHYRTDALKIVSFGVGNQRVMFIHSDDSYYSSH